MARSGQAGLDCTVEGRIHFLGKLWNEEGQDIAEYAVMLAVILVLAIGTIRLIGSNAGTVFSLVSSALS
jgi:Flp pilus assembly pilin Flp